MSRIALIALTITLVAATVAMPAAAHYDGTCHSHADNACHDYDPPPSSPRDEVPTEIMSMDLSGRFMNQKTNRLRAGKPAKFRRMKSRRVKSR